MVEFSVLGSENLAASSKKCIVTLHAGLGVMRPTASRIPNWTLYAISYDGWSRFTKTPTALASLAILGDCEVSGVTGVCGFDGGCWSVGWVDCSGAEDSSVV